MKNSASTPRCAISLRTVPSIRVSSSRAAMTTEHRTRSEGDDRARPGAVVNASSAGNRRTQRKCHKAASVIDRNSAVVPQKMRVAHMIRQGGS